MADPSLPKDPLLSNRASAAPLCTKVMLSFIVCVCDVGVCKSQREGDEEIRVFTCVIQPAYSRNPQAHFTHPCACCTAFSVVMHMYSVW